MVNMGSGTQGSQGKLAGLVSMWVMLPARNQDEAEVSAGSEEDCVSTWNHPKRAASTRGTRHGAEQSSKQVGGLGEKGLWAARSPQGSEEGTRSCLHQVPLVDTTQKKN